MTETTRRTMLAGAAGLTAVAALAACGENETPGTGAGGDSVDTGDQPTGGTSAAAPTGAGLAALADIPVGGGKIFADEKVVVTQPAAGEVKAFSALCTHQNCAVTTIEDGLIICPCHQSRFKIADGSVAQGSATKALPPKTVRVENGRVVLG